MFKAGTSGDINVSATYKALTDKKQPFVFYSVGKPQELNYRATKEETRARNKTRLSSFSAQLLAFETKGRKIFRRFLQVFIRKIVVLHLLGKILIIGSHIEMTMP